MDVTTGRLERIEETQEAHTTALRAIGDKLDRIIEILTPPDTQGPTLDEILAQLVAIITDQGALLRRVDRRTGAMAAAMGLEGADGLEGLPGGVERPPNGSAREGRSNGHALDGGHLSP